MNGSQVLRHILTSAQTVHSRLQYEAARERSPTGDNVTILQCPAVDKGTRRKSQGAHFNIYALLTFESTMGDRLKTSLEGLPPSRYPRAICLISYFGPPLTLGSALRPLPTRPVGIGPQGNDHCTRCHSDRARVIRMLLGKKRPTASPRFPVWTIYRCVKLPPS